MQFNVPQFIDIEDRIVGPLTAKQLGWLALDGVTLLIVWNLLDFSAFIIVAIISTALFGALAFFRPHDLPLVHFVVASLSFTTKPKLYVWKRNPQKSNPRKIQTVSKKNTPIPEKKSLDSKKLQEISKILDQ
ncbi:MAG: PrgI family protein [Patescibacteria group bacterium]